VLGLFCVIIMVGIAAHEPWMDEAQSWLLVRDLGLGELLFGRLRYEGHPAAWYLAVLPLAKLGAPYWSQSLLAAMFALVGAAMLFHLREVPLVLRATAPLGYFFVYQYAVVARSYVMLIPILVGVAMVYPHRERRPLAFAGLLILMTQVSVYSALVAVGLCGLAVADVLRGRLQIVRELRTRYAIAIGALALNGGLLVAMLYPPEDLAIAPTIEASVGLAHTLDIARLVAKEITFASPWLAWASLALVAVWAWNRRVLAELLVVVGALLGVVSVYFNIWHVGLFAFAIMLVVWLGYGHDIREHRFSLMIDRAGLAVLVLLSLQHIRWSMAALGGEIRKTYSGSAAAAAFIEEHDLRDGTLYGVGFPAISLQPYFADNIYDNYDMEGGHAFWDWSSSSPWFFRPKVVQDVPATRAWTQDTLDESPDYVLLTLKFDIHYDVCLMELDAHPDYRMVALFPGEMQWKGQPWQRDNFALFAHRRTELARTAAAVPRPPVPR
jgi:hypothetical protein